MDGTAVALDDERKLAIDFFRLLDSARDGAFRIRFKIAADALHDHAARLGKREAASQTSESMT
ncbi:MAG: hypothetical protein HND48_13690 [Chloroflexi bacterium]|nr:hypothetical protein [Chloroflexota bacterium]